MKPRLTSWVLSEQRAGASSVTEHQDPIWTRRGRQPGAGQGVDPGVAREEARGHMSANLLVFFWRLFFFLMQVLPHLLCSDDLKTVLWVFFFLRVFGKVLRLSKNSPYQCFHNVRPHPVSELGELLSTEKSLCFSFHALFKTARAHTGPLWKYGPS